MVRLFFLVALLALTPYDGTGQQRRLAYTLPGTADVRRIADLTYRTISGADTVMYGTTLRYDVFLPSSNNTAPRGVVLFVHGGMVAGSKQRVSPKDDLPSYVEWGRLVAAAGLVGITFSHRLTTEDLHTSHRSARF